MRPTHLRRVPDAHEPQPLHAQAMENLRFIRQTLEHATAFTAVSGWGLVLVGVLACGFAACARWLATPTSFIATWLVAAIVCLGLSVGMSARKARRLGLSLTTGAGRKFIVAFLPTMIAGAFLTFAAATSGETAHLAGMWLLLYGASVVAAGSNSVPLVPAMGISFMVLGAAALLAPAWGNWFMALGFGGVHAGYGVAIAVRHGG